VFGFGGVELCWDGFGVWVWLVWACADWDGDCGEVEADLDLEDEDEFELVVFRLLGGSGMDIFCPGLMVVRGVILFAAQMASTVVLCSLAMIPRVWPARTVCD